MLGRQQARKKEAGQGVTEHPPIATDTTLPTTETDTAVGGARPFATDPLPYFGTRGEMAKGLDAGLFKTTRCARDDTRDGERGSVSVSFIPPPSPNSPHHIESAPRRSLRDQAASNASSSSSSSPPPAALAVRWVRAPSRAGRPGICQFEPTAQAGGMAWPSACWSPSSLPYRSRREGTQARQGSPSTTQAGDSCTLQQRGWQHSAALRL